MKQRLSQIFLRLDSEDQRFTPEVDVDPFDDLPLEPLPRAVVLIVGAFCGLVAGYAWCWFALAGGR